MLDLAHRDGVASPSSKPDVVLYGSREQLRFLRHDSDAASQMIYLHLSRIGVVEQHLSVRGIEKSLSLY